MRAYCSYFDCQSLETDKTHVAIGIAGNFEAQSCRFFDPAHKFIERACLGVAPCQLWDRGDQPSFIVPLNNYIEFSSHDKNSTHVTSDSIPCKQSHSTDVKTRAGAPFSNFFSGGLWNFRNFGSQFLVSLSTTPKFMNLQLYTHYIIWLKIVFLFFLDWRSFRL
jgi:hypothetical protein